MNCSNAMDCMAWLYFYAETIIPAHKSIILYHTLFVLLPSKLQKKNPYRCGLSMRLLDQNNRYCKQILRTARMPIGKTKTTQMLVTRKAPVFNRSCENDPQLLRSITFSKPKLTHMHGQSWISKKNEAGVSISPVNWQHVYESSLYHWLTNRYQ